MYLNEHLFRAGYMINVSSVLSQKIRDRLIGFPISCWYFV